MFKGIYTAASGMLAQQRKTEILTNNMANANTPGFKAEQSTIRSFPEMLMSSVSSTNVPTKKGLHYSQIQRVGSLSTGIYVQETMPSFVQGNIYETSFNTDLALINGYMPTNGDVEGTVFFRLQHLDGGEAYTRNGSFTLDGQGYLVSSEGYYVLSESGERIQLQNEEFQVAEDGTITASGATIATLGVAFSENPNTLTKQNNGIFRTEDGAALPSAFTQGNVTFALKQRFLEGSNVDPSQAMTDLLTAYRAFEANQKVIQAYDRSMEKAVNEIGKV